MNRDQVIKCLAVLRDSYPMSKVWEQEPEAMIRSWLFVVGDDKPQPDGYLNEMTYEAASTVLEQWIKDRGEKYPPSPGDMRNGILDLLQTCQTEEEREVLQPGWRAWRNMIRADRIMDERVAGRALRG